MPKKPFVLLILDGWGYREKAQGNAIATALTPTWDKLKASCPHTLLSGSGEKVGLPSGQMGNSEVGHLTMGAGRVVYQELTRLSKAIETGTFFENPVLQNAFAQAHNTKRAVHIFGLLSPGGVHSHEDHIFACLKMARQHHQGPLYVHAFLDGRDTPPKSAQASLKKLTSFLEPLKANLASVCGRYYAMDRDQRFERTKMAFDAIAHGKAPFTAKSGEQALELAYQRQETDEFVQPTCMTNTRPLKEGDVVIYMNFRADRARALSEAFTAAHFNGFDRGNFAKPGAFVTLTQYDSQLLANVAFLPVTIQKTLGEHLKDQKKTQLRIAETEKYAHVTFFFNGGKEPPLKGEQRVLIPSPKVATYDLKPQMHAPELTDALVKHILSQQFDVIICNYANADMVGHTGNFEATIKAIETLDSCLAKIVAALKKVDGQVLITADHGNAEYMLDEKGQPHTAHTSAPVPLLYVGQQPISLKPGTLADIAPTLLSLMALPIPNEMTGQSLIK